MPEKLKTRPLSATRQQRGQIQRRSSLNVIFPHLKTPGNIQILSGIDLRTILQKLEDLENEIRESKNESTSEQNLNNLVLMQVYTSLEYGENSIENARAYLNLSKFYFNRKQNFLLQANLHALNAREILDYLNLKPNDNNLKENLLGYEIYFILIQCSLNAKQREMKSETEHILSIDKTHIDHDIKIVKNYLEKLKHLIPTNDYEKMYIEYVFIKFDTIVINLKEFNKTIYELIEQIDNYLNDQIKHRIDFYLRGGLYLINFNETIQDSLMYYRKAFELAEEQEKIKPSNEHKHQLANAILQRNIAKVKTNRLTDDLENNFHYAIQLYKQPNGEMNKNVLKVIDELATFYIEIKKSQDALNVLCETLPDKIRLFGDFSEEVIQTESRIGEIYLKEGECLNAAEHLKVCLDIQEFVYGVNDSRTCQTRNSVELLKKDPTVSRTFFARIQDRSSFRLSNRTNS